MTPILLFGLPTSGTGVLEFSDHPFSPVLCPLILFYIIHDAFLFLSRKITVSYSSVNHDYHHYPTPDRTIFLTKSVFLYRPNLELPIFLQSFCSFLFSLSSLFKKHRSFLLYIVIGLCSVPYGLPDFSLKCLRSMSPSVGGFTVGYQHKTISIEIQQGRV